jgi:hypothetical protein
VAKQTNPDCLRCLAIQQPWAWAVCVGIKTVENRTQPTPYRGLIAILASTKRTNVNELVRSYPDLELDADFFTYGAVIGVANLVDVVEMNPSLGKNPSAAGPLCWLLEDARLLPKPVLAKGKLNLYTLDAVESKAVWNQLPNLQRPSLDPSASAWAEVYRVNALVLRGWQHRRENRPDDAITWFDEALKLQPEDFPALVGRALCLLDKNDASTVIRDANMRLSIEPDDVFALMLRRAAYLKRGEDRKSGRRLRQSARDQLSRRRSPRRTS